MVEPETDTQGWLASVVRGFRQWLERDLNQTHPLSFLFGLLFVVPGMALDNAEAPDFLVAPVLILGILLCIAWTGYVIVRRFAKIGRELNNAYSDQDETVQGEDTPIRCFECGEVLPEFERPDDGVTYRFKGWDCENCGASLDRHGRPF